MICNWAIFHSYVCFPGRGAQRLCLWCGRCRGNRPVLQIYLPGPLSPRSLEWGLVPPYDDQSLVALLLDLVSLGSHSYKGDWIWHSVDHGPPGLWVWVPITFESADFSINLENCAGDVGGSAHGGLQFWFNSVAFCRGSWPDRAVVLPSPPSSRSARGSLYLKTWLVSKRWRSESHRSHYRLDDLDGGCYRSLLTGNLCWTTGSGLLLCAVSVLGHSHIKMFFFFFFFFLAYVCLLVGMATISLKKVLWNEVWRFHGVQHWVFVG